MGSITFDKLTYFQRWKESGVSKGQARAQTDALDEALRDSVVTRGDLNEALAPIKTEIAVLKWMMGVMMGGIVALVLKAFLIS